MEFFWLSEEKAIQSQTTVTGQPESISFYGVYSSVHLRILELVSFVQL